MSESTFRHLVKWSLSQESDPERAYAIVERIYAFIMADLPDRLTRAESRPWADTLAIVDRMAQDKVSIHA